MLELDLTEPPLTAPPGDPLAAVLARRRTALRDVLDGLARGAADPKVVGMVAKLGAPMALATAQEVRDAVLAFRRSGKPTLAWAETFGEFEPGTVPYYLATAFDSIWLGPSGDVVLAGVRVDALFLRRALDTVGVEAQIGRRHEYKNASNALIETGFTDAHREATAGLVASVADQLADGIASRPGIDQARAQGAARGRGRIGSGRGGRRAGGPSGLSRPGARRGAPAGRRRVRAALRQPLPPSADRGGASGHRQGHRSGVIPRSRSCTPTESYGSGAAGARR